MVRDQYRYFTQFYDQYAEQIDDPEWFSYLKEISGIADFRGKLVLDLGCGTGNMLLRFAQDGAIVSGVDLNQEMLMIADQKFFSAKQRAALYCADISNFYQKEQYDFVYSICDTVNYLNHERFAEMLTHLSEMMDKNAIFTFDVIHEDYLKVRISEKERIISYENEFVMKRTRTEDKLLTEVTILTEHDRYAETHIQYLLNYAEIVRKEFSEQFKIVGEYEMLTLLKANPATDKKQIILEKT